MKIQENDHLGFREEAKRLKKVYDALVKTKKKFEKISQNRNLSNNEYHEFQVASDKLINFAQKCKNFIRPKKNGIGKFSIDDYIIWQQKNYSPSKYNPTITNYQRPTNPSFKDESIYKNNFGPHNAISNNIFGNNFPNESKNNISPLPVFNSNRNFLDVDLKSCGLNIDESTMSSTNQTNNSKDLNHNPDLRNSQSESFLNDQKSKFYEQDKLLSNRNEQRFNDMGFPNGEIPNISQNNTSNGDKGLYNREIFTPNSRFNELPDSARFNYNQNYMMHRMELNRGFNPYMQYNQKPNSMFYGIGDRSFPYSNSQARPLSFRQPNMYGQPSIYNPEDPNFIPYKSPTMRMSPSALKSNLSTFETDSPPKNADGFYNRNFYNPQRMPQPRPIAQANKFDEFGNNISSSDQLNQAPKKFSPNSFLRTNSTIYPSASSVINPLKSNSSKDRSPREINAFGQSSKSISLETILDSSTTNKTKNSPSMIKQLHNMVGLGTEPSNSILAGNIPTDTQSFDGFARNPQTPSFSSRPIVDPFMPHRYQMPGYQYPLQTPNFRPQPVYDAHSRAASSEFRNPTIPPNFEFSDLNQQEIMNQRFKTFNGFEIPYPQNQKIPLKNYIANDISASLSKSSKETQQIKRSRKKAGPSPTEPIKKIHKKVGRKPKNPQPIHNQLSEVLANDELPYIKTRRLNKTPDISSQYHQGFAKSFTENPIINLPQAIKKPAFIPIEQKLVTKATDILSENIKPNNTEKLSNKLSQKNYSEKYGDIQSLSREDLIAKMHDKKISEEVQDYLLTHFDAALHQLITFSSKLAKNKSQKVMNLEDVQTLSQNLFKNFYNSFESSENSNIKKPFDFEEQFDMKPGEVSQGILEHRKILEMIEKDKNKY